MTESQGTVLVIAKAPDGGRSKTRLVPPLSREQAAALHTALLIDTLDGCRAEAEDVRILHESETDVGVLSRLAPGVRLEPQRGRGLADALRYGIADHLSDQRPVAIVSSDIPGVPAGSIRRAFQELSRGADVVLGPACDGGYWLIAMKAAHEEPFRDIAWSTPAVLALTRQRCDAAGLRTVELERWRDIDTLVDLAFLASDAPPAAARTRQLLATLDGLVHEPPEQELASSELVSGSPWRVLLHDRLQGATGDSEYSYLAVPRAVFVAAVTVDDQLVLVRQYRHPVRDWTLEVPAGSVKDGETALEAAERELREESGGRARSWTHLSTFFSSSAHLSLRSDAFLARGVELEESAPEAGEDITVVTLPLHEAAALARSGRLAEGQTALTVLLALEQLERADDSRR